MSNATRWQYRRLDGTWMDVEPWQAASASRLLGLFTDFRIALGLPPSPQFAGMLRLSPGCEVCGREACVCEPSNQPESKPEPKERPK